MEGIKYFFLDINNRFAHCRKKMKNAGWKSGVFGVLCVHQFYWNIFSRISMFFAWLISSTMLFTFSFLSNRAL